MWQTETQPIDDLPPEDIVLGAAANAASQRAQLARMLLDVLSLPAGQVNDNERSFTADILNDLLDYVRVEVRTELAERLASVLMPPPVLLRRLLLEPISVAGPLLEAFRDMPDNLLIEAARVGPDHQRVIAQRAVLSDIVANELLDSDDVQLVIQVLRRPEITIAQERLDTLLTRTIHEEELREPVLQRLELEPWQAFTMFWWMGPTDRRRIISRFAVDRTVIQNALKDLYRVVFTDPDPDIVVKRILTLCDRRHRARGKNGEVVSMEMVERMLAAARANPSAELCAGVGLLAGVTAETASRCLHDESGEPFAIMCKSIGVSRAAFNALMSKAVLLRRSSDNGDGPIGVDGPAKREYLTGVFDMIARDYSRTILRYWDWRRDQLGPADRG